MANSEFPKRGRGRPKKDQPVGPIERQAIDERRGGQFDDLLANRNQKPAARVKPAGGSMLPAEPEDEDRAGLAQEPKPGPREAAKGGRGRKALKRKRNPCGKLKRAARRDHLAELVEDILTAPGKVEARVKRQTARVKPPKGMTRLDQLLAAMVRLWEDPALWLTAAEIEGSVADQLPRDDVKWLLATGRKRGLVDMREVKDPIREQVVPAPGGYVPRRLWRVSRAGRAWVGLVG